MKNKRTSKGLRHLDDAALARVGGGSDYSGACLGGAALGGVFGFYASGANPIGAAVGAGLGCVYGMFGNYVEVAYNAQ
jgi:hypothetical protein